MKLGLFINTQFPEGYDLRTASPKWWNKCARHVTPGSSRYGSRTTT